MTRILAGSDFEGWVGQLAVSSRRQRAKRHLLRSGNPAVPALRGGLRHPEAIVRRTCAGLLDKLLDEASIPDLVAAIEDEDPGVCARALHTLACDQCKQNDCRPGEELFLPRAIELAGGHPSADVRAAAIDALGKVARRRPDVLAALAAVAEHDPDAGLRSMARRRSSRLGASEEA